MRALAAAAVALSLSVLGDPGTALAEAPGPDEADRIEAFKPRAQSSVVVFDPPVKDPTWGPRFAPVTVDFFYDPILYYYNRQRIYLVLKELRKRHPRRVRVVFRVYSPSSNTFLAEALLEAFAQGKFEQMALRTHTYRKMRQRKDVLTVAKELGMDPETIKAAWRDARHLSKIRANHNLRKRHRMRGYYYSFLLFNGAEPRINSDSRMRIAQMENFYDAAYARATELLGKGIPLSAVYERTTRQIADARPPVKIYPGLVDGERKPIRRRGPRKPMPRPALVAGKMPGVPLHTRGPNNAAVTVTIFCSLQSRHCARLGGTLEAVRKIYGTKVQVAFRHLFDDDDPGQPGARLVHEAAMCANDQGGFWRFYDQQVTQLRWRSRVQPISMGQLRSRAKLAQLDVDDFTSCIESAKHAKAVEREVRAARRAGITKTPSMVIGGRLYTGTKSQNELMYLISRQMKPGLLERWAPMSIWGS